MWTDSLHDAFEQSGTAGADFCYVLQRLEAERPFDWPHVLEQAAQGLGCTIHEGLSFALEGDGDSPEEFDGVSFFFGDKLSSVMPVDEFVRLLHLASAGYLNAFPENRDRVSVALQRVNARYAENRLLP